MLWGIRNTSGETETGMFRLAYLQIVTYFRSKIGIDVFVCFAA